MESVGWLVSHCLICCFSTIILYRSSSSQLACTITSPFECRHSWATAGWEAAWHGMISCSPSPPSHVLLLPGTGIQSRRYSKACQPSDTGEVSTLIMLHRSNTGSHYIEHHKGKKLMTMKAVQCRWATHKDSFWLTADTHFTKADSKMYLQLPFLFLSITAKFSHQSQRK